MQEISESQIKKKLRRYIKKYKYNILVFYLTCSLQTAIKRDSQRQKFMRERMVRKVHISQKPEKNDIIIDTEKNSISKVVKLIYNKL